MQMRLRYSLEILPVVLCLYKPVMLPPNPSTLRAIDVAKLARAEVRKRGDAHRVVVIFASKGKKDQILETCRNM